MQLNVTTDYAIRIVLYLSKRGGIVPSIELSEEMGIPKTSVLKIAKRLNQGGFIKAQVGTQGGFFIAKKEQDISMLELIELMEGTVKINHCIEEGRYCNRFATEDCPVKKFYCTLQRQLEEKLASITVYNLLHHDKQI